MASIAVRIRALCVGAFALLATGCTIGEEFYAFHGEREPADDAGHNRGPIITLMFVGPLQTDVGYPITLSGTAKDPDGDRVDVRWLSRRGVIADAKTLDTTYTCKRHGEDTITFLVSDGRKQQEQSVQVTCF